MDAKCGLQEQPPLHDLPALRAHLQRSVDKLRFTRVDWNEYYQRLYDRTCATNHERQQRRQSMAKLLQDFQSYIEAVSSMLVEQLALPANQRVIKPTQLGGHAGGEKFVHGHVLFKFARDWENIYGSERGAQKAAELEVRALNAIVRTQLTGLHHSVAGVARVRGSTIYATALISLRKEHSLVYGSCDGGNVIEDGSSLPVARELAEQVVR